jgi:hypothetical protein
MIKNKQLKNKQLIKELAHKIEINLEIIKAMQSENHVVNNVVHLGLDLIKILKEELDK